MAGKNYAFKTKHKELGESVETVTLENAASLSIYQLRQELTKRGIFDEVFGTEGEKRHINFESCLEVLVSELVKEKDKEQLKHAEELEAAKAPEGETVEQKLAREKEERKQAAIERSKQRQADKAYFESRKNANEEAAKKKAEDAAAAAAAASEGPSEPPSDPAGAVEEEKEEQSRRTDDPFSSGVGAGGAWR